MDAQDSGSEITGYACRAVGDGLKRVVEVFLPQEVVENFDTVRLLAVERTEAAEYILPTARWVQISGLDDSRDWIVSLEHRLGRIPALAVPITWLETPSNPTSWHPEANQQRFIRLKEVAPGGVEKRTPPDGTMAISSGLERREYVLRGDHHGFVSSGNATLRGPGVKEILLLGCSVAEGCFALEEDRYPAKLETLARQEGIPLNLYASARTSSNLLSQLNILLNKVGPGGSFGRRVILAMSLNDFQAGHWMDSYWVRHPHFGQLCPTRDVGVRFRPPKFDEMRRVC
uniref:hypothetical protein n=1 Tax=Tessaracoccus timonensis TaxID=2161816 RepID=UPI000D54AFD4|nr:hypothetical protein [Tessaracoccus timonensis]